MLLLRVIVVLTVLLGVNYVAWRWLFSLNWDAWWIAVPLVLAETYSLIDVCLFGMTMWRAKGRPAPPPPAADATVDVFITTYNEPIELVMATALAAQAIRFPHETWVLDDGDRAEMRAAAEEAGLGCITRSSDWKDRPRHAKAGNLNNALELTTGEFVLILDADQIPRPEILDHTLGYFRDEKVALVQTPQVFSNVATGDPLGSQAPLFYGPIQQGKDGWNAAFFCGSNAVLRREALMQLGIVGYVRELDRRIGTALRTASRVVAKARSHPAAADPAVKAALDEVSGAIGEARAAVAGGAPIGTVTYELHRRVDAASYSLVASDVAGLESDLAEIRALTRSEGGASSDVVVDLDAIVSTLADRELSPLNALESVQAVLQSITVDRPGEAQPIMPLATISVTEDMATCMRLHGLGWRTVYHHELLADGLAPEDVGTMLTQRLRWAQGTMQVFLRENPLLQRALSIPQRLMYFATMWSYLSGYAAVVYFAAPIVFLVLGILPVDSLAADFFVRFIPFMIINQLLFLVAAKGTPTWRGQQYSLALFPVWIEACSTAVNNVLLRIPLGFAVTPKTRQESTAIPWRLIRVQLVVMILLVVAVVVGVIHLVVDGAQLIGTGVNIAWAVFDLVVLSVLFRAVAFRGFDAAPSPVAQKEHA
ncbi:glycosyltransferase [Rathayibacter sp. VKM Ac-2856]|uniref:glycosyltransferase n=1 Tax=unclassified Rathayibacter TaxID=2609250 RepID=UPI001567C3B8|nr:MULTISPECIES: glycosyltransferase [unclassified Rathayibacter]NQX03390.1 glycosyltransferase [Rathayibacter sp. VKM Ac-2858]NQX18558.1 glycosyltransferase [Rathayibacter sp. VKM Ac-2856]